jgi:basic amino acid/polyamine antiporter, APA family
LSLKSRDTRPPARPAGLERAIGLWDLIAIMINVVVGAGIFGLPAKTFALVGPFSIAAWLLCTAIMGLVALAFAEVGSRFTHTGGPYLYAYAAFGPRLGFLIGWITWVSRLFSFATVSNLAITYVSGPFPSLASGLPRFACVTAVSVGITVFLVAGVHRSALVNNTLTVCKLLLLGSFAIVGLVFLDGRHFASRPLPSPGQWQGAIMLMTFAFVGIESAMINTGEMRNPRRDVPRALGVALGVIALLYVLIQIACIGSVPDLGSSQRPVADAAQHVLGTAGAEIVAIGALTTMLGTLFAVMLTGSRLPFAFAERRQVPQWLATIHPRFKTPHVAILTTTTLAWVLTLYSSFFGALTVTAVTRLVGYVTTCVALIVLRHKRTAECEPGHFVAPAGGFVAALGAVACVWLILATPRTELIEVGIIAATGMVFGGAYSILRRRGSAGAVRVV